MGGVKICIFNRVQIVLSFSSCLNLNLYLLIVGLSIQVCNKLLLFIAAGREETAVRGPTTISQGEERGTG